MRFETKRSSNTKTPKKDLKLERLKRTLADVKPLGEVYKVTKT